MGFPRVGLGLQAGLQDRADTVPERSRCDNVARRYDGDPDPLRTPPMTDALPGSPLIRAALIVSDLDRSQRFYRDLLGFTEEYASGETRSEAFTTLLGQPAGALCRFRVLKQPGPSFGMIGLFELSQPSPPAVPPPTASVASGNVVLVFYLADLDPFVARLGQYGGRLLAPVVDLASRHRSQRELVACDPDGVRVNLIEREPAEALRTSGPGRVF
jgi:catechol 2,3-dioxygenase-like lactoylglutathione lyase family enzyme